MTGACGSGGFGLAAAEIDRRIKAVAIVSMYDIRQAERQGLAAPPGRMRAQKRTSTKSPRKRWAEVDGAERTLIIGTPQASPRLPRPLIDNSTITTALRAVRTRERSRTSDAQMMLFWSYQHLDWISPRPLLFITGDEAHSRISVTTRAAVRPNRRNSHAARFASERRLPPGRSRHVLDERKRFLTARRTRWNLAECRASRITFQPASKTAGAELVALACTVLPARPLASAVMGGTRVARVARFLMPCREGLTALRRESPS